MTFYEEEIQKNIDNLEKEGRLSLTKGFIQHGNVSVYEHCLAVCVCKGVNKRSFAARLFFV